MLSVLSFRSFAVSLWRRPRIQDRPLADLADLFLQQSQGVSGKVLADMSGRGGLRVACLAVAEANTTYDEVCRMSQIVNFLHCFGNLQYLWPQRLRKKVIKRKLFRWCFTLSQIRAGTIVWRKYSDRTNIYFEFLLDISIFEMPVASLSHLKY